MRRVTSQVPDGRTRAPRRGTAAVEFAVAAPVLLLIAFGCTDLGRAIGSYVAVSNAARVGAEYGATHAYTSYTYASWENQVTLQAQQEMQGSPTVQFESAVGHGLHRPGNGQSVSGHRDDDLSLQHVHKLALIAAKLQFDALGDHAAVSVNDRE